MTPTPVIDFEPVLGEEFTLTVGSNAILNAEGASITFKGIVSDNRCPLNTTCITGGAALVEMTVKESATAQEETMQWSIGPDKTEPSMQTIAGFDVELIEVEPIPGDTDSSAPEQVHLVVTTSTNSPA